MLNNNLQKVIIHIEKEYSKLQLGRANPVLIEGIKVEIYGGIQSIKNISNVSVMDNQTISIRPWDRSNIHSIAKAITEEGLGLNPQTMADSIIIKFPLLTEERRKEIVKYAKGLLEDAKISIRNIRGEELKLIKGNKNFSEDKIKEEEYKLQNLINEYNNKVELLYENKIKDIMKI